MREASGDRAWLLVLLFASLPALLLASIAGGSVAWFHSHGHAGAHVHVMPDAGQLEHADLDHDHVAWHSHGDAPENDHDGEAPPGLKLEFPRLLGTLSSIIELRANSVLADGELLLEACPITATRPAPSHAGLVPRRTPIPSGWPPQRTRRTAVAALVCSSRALRI